MMKKTISKAKTFLYNIRLSIDKIQLIYDNSIALSKNDLKSLKVNLGQIQSYLNTQKPNINSLAEVEFQIFSQFGDDGIIQYLINKLDIPNKVFIEFGVENYKESNTRFLLINNKWSGLVIDGSEKHINFIKEDIVYWMYDLNVKHSFITVENINGIITEFLQKGYPTEIGILSIDIDGNDYHVWNEIDVINPVIVICEYNAVFGDQKAWTIPYKADFYWLGNDPTFQYWGASLKSLCILAEQKGYYFIGCNSNGNNAYFVRKDRIGNFKPLNCTEGFVEAAFRMFADKKGVREKSKKSIELIRGREILNTETNELEII